MLYDSGLAVKNARWQTCALTSALVVMWTASAAAQSVSITVLAGDDPPVAVAELDAAMVASARADGFDPIPDAFASAAENLASGAVPAARLEPFAEARRLADRGWSAYLAVEVDFAASQLANARRLASQVADLDGGLELYADITLRLGVVLAHLKRDAAAADAFRLARALAPDRAVTMAEFSPDIVAAYDAAIAEQRATVTVSVAADPVDARIEVDGADVGAGPARIDLEVGHHIVVARAPGRVARGQLVSVAADTPALELSLDPDPLASAVLAGGAQLAVGASEAGSQTVVDGLMMYGELQGVVLAASVWRRGAPALLGQWCEGVPASCTRVAEIGYPDPSGLEAAVRTLWQTLQEARPTRSFPPTLPVDARLTRGESRPGAETNGETTSCAWCRSPWLWVGVGAAALAAGSVYLLSRDGDVTPVIDLDPCAFAACP